VQPGSDQQLVSTPPGAPAKVHAIGLWEIRPGALVNSARQRRREDARNGVFVGIAMSGGGSRAARLSESVNHNHTRFWGGGEGAKWPRAQSPSETVVLHGEDLEPTRSSKRPEPRAATLDAADEHVPAYRTDGDDGDRETLPSAPEGGSVSRVG
jgi:hypothetical protein